MSHETMISKLNELKSLEEMQRELTEAIESIKDEFKQLLTDQKLEEYEIGTYIIRYTTVLSNRFDTTSFKKVMPEVYKAYTKQVTSKRFSIN